MQHAASVYMGSFGTFAALVISDGFGKYRRSLRGARTGKMRDNAAVGYRAFAGAASLCARSVIFAAIISDLESGRFARFFEHLIPSGARTKDLVCQNSAHWTKFSFLEFRNFR